MRDVAAILNVIFQQSLEIEMLSIAIKIALRWMLYDLIDDRWALA